MKRKYFYLGIIFATLSCQSRNTDDINGTGDDPNTSEKVVHCDISFDEFTGQTVYPENFGANISAQKYGYSKPFEMTKSNEYQDAMKKLGWSVLRVNIGGWGQYIADPEGQLTENQKLYWEAIDILIENLGHFHSGKLMITCGAIPEWMDVHDQNDISLFAELVVKLAERFQNRGVNVDYWQIFNEPAKDKFPEVCYIFNETADRLREINPMYKIGGPATPTGGYTDFIKQFIEISGNHADFISYHNYGANAAIIDFNSIDALMQTAFEYKSQAYVVRQLISVGL